MPPLCTVGYGIAHLEPKFILGAFYLFLINSVFITLATFVIVKYLHFSNAFGEEDVRHKHAARWSAVIIIALLVPSILSGIRMIQDTNFERSAQRLVDQNKNLGKSYIYDFKTNIESRPHTIDLYLAGEKLDATRRERLCQQAEEYGITRSQLTFHEDAAFQNELMTESEIIQGIIDGHNRQVDQLKGQVDSLTLAIEFFQAQKLPAELITREIAAQYAGVQEVTLTRGEIVGADGGQARPAVVAIIRCSQALKEAERSRIEQWLQVRLGIEDVNVIIRTK